MSATDGGTCPNVGCAASKTLITAGNRNLSFAEAMKLKYATREKMCNGATLYHEDSHEIINCVSFAMQTYVKYTQLRDQIFTRPTIGDGLNDLFANEVK